MIERICLLANYNLYESKRHFAQGLIAAFEKKGIETKVIDVQENLLNAQGIASLVAFDPQFTCSFNTFMPTRDNQYLWDIIKIPHLYIHLDPALYASHLTQSPYIAISCVDRFDCAALEGGDFRRTFFLPHAVENGISYAEGKERTFDCVFLGSCYDYESLKTIWKGDLTAEQVTVLDEAVEIVLSDNKTPIADALVAAWEHASLDPRKVDFITLYKYIDYYSRGKDRVDLLRSFKDTKVHVFGEVAPDIPSCKKGWNHYLGNQKNIIIHPPVNFTEGIEIIKNSKVVLNSMPFFKNGSHERILYALGCGALPVTSDNLWVQEQFSVGNEVIAYQNRSLEGVEGQVKAILKDEPRRLSGVTAGKKKVLKNHTWDNRADTILNFLKELG